ncbi:hypothetical protein EHQ81_12060 [Leptospira selangorensis]|uniref:DUF4136 domain-containing protein n=1 Tax=Leptospira selangorensis TaxID=2484982 RepID=A0A5F2C3E0_9LEPT|nr:hypothetical protein [Leptospira selangorensis]TGM12982.1 hypothetical protein EHQ81_12060 [Leptospira selangorensis]TGM21266.1 hypothetical protein EHQ82_09685 [Leptospira selangorensis]
MRKYFRLISFVLSINLNCATFIFYPENFEKVATNESRSEINKKTFGINVKYKLFNDDVEELPSPKRQNEISKMLENFMLKSGYVSQVKSNTESAEINCDIIYTKKIYPQDGLTFLSGITLLIIPTMFSINTIIDVSFKDKKGKLLGRYERNAESFNWLGLVFLPAMPFYFPEVEGREMHLQLISSIFKEASLNNILK